MVTIMTQRTKMVSTTTEQTTLWEPRAIATSGLP